MLIKKSLTLHVNCGVHKSQPVVGSLFNNAFSVTKLYYVDDRISEWR
jgi:hypothetical protein